MAGFGVGRSTSFVVPVAEGLSTADWAQVASAVFTALAAIAALLTVVRAESERASSNRPKLDADFVVDIPKQEVRLTVLNTGAPAREVRVDGVVGDYGFSTLLGPTMLWRTGESRTMLVSIPPIGTTAHVVVTGRDLRKRHLFAVTPFGGERTWRVRHPRILGKRFGPWPDLSPKSVFATFFPGAPGIEDVRHKPMNVELVERHF